MESYQELLLAGGIAYFLAMVMLRLLVQKRWFREMLDHPNHRSLHSYPVPRTGGLAIMSGVLGAWLYIFPAHLWLLGSALLLLAAISFLDDLYEMPVIVRFLSHCVAAIIFIVGYCWSLWPMWLLVILVLGLVWMLNLYNFMDGANGLAGGMTLLGFGCYACAAWLAGDAGFSALNFVVAMAALAFLGFNFDPARIFMGDIGSVPLGFLAGTFGVLGYQQALWPIWFPVLVFSPFIVDATVTFLRRVWKRQPFWQAHREHYYQRLILMGWSHAQLAWTSYALMLGTGLTGLLLLSQSWMVVCWILAGWFAVYLLMMWNIDWRWKIFQGQLL